MGKKKPSVIASLQWVLPVALGVATIVVLAITRL